MWCEVMEVDEFWTSKLCCLSHCEMTKVKYKWKEINSVLNCSNNKCGTAIDHSIYVSYKYDSEWETT